MPTARLTPLVFVAACLAASAGARAQPLFPQAQSIESTVANADLVFLATLVKVGDAERADGREVHEVTIHIEETIKQDLFTTEPYTKLSVYLPAPTSVLADWKKRSSRLLVAHDSDAPKATIVFELIDDKMQVMKADMTLLRDPKAVIDAAKETARQMPAAIRRINTFRLKVPRALVAGTTWEPYYKTGGHLVLSVPVDKQLEKGLQYLGDENYLTRAEGARALRYFKSDENVARVKALLKDPGRFVQDQAQDGKVEAFYAVRYEAYETLTAWKIDVDKPVLREEVRK